jgi:hypothetical protein
MDTTRGKSDLSIVLKEVDRLSKEPDLMMTGAEMVEYEELRVLGEILLKTQSPPSIYYTGT